MDEIRSRGLGMEEAGRRGVFCRFGEGTAELAAVIGRLRALGYTGWLVVEQDRHLHPGQTLASLAADARHNRDVLRDLGV
jgi:inosose dehydratase